MVVAGRGARGEHCRGAWDHAPVVLRVVAGGANHKREDWLAVVGLVRSPVARVVVEQQAGDRPAVPLRRRGSFGWRAFALWTGAGNRANSVHAYDARGRELWATEVSWSYNPPCMPENDDICGDHPPPGPWTEVRDPVADQSGAPDPERLQRIAFAHPAVRRLVAGREFFVDPLWGWQKCNDETIGGGLSLWFPYAISFDGTIPVEETRDNARVAYFAGHAHARARHVRGVDVWVDLNAGRVVGVDLSGLQQESREDEVGSAHVDLETIGELRPGGGPDAECPEYRD